MALDMTVTVTSGVEATEVPDDIAADLTEAYEALSELPVNRMVNVDFGDVNETDADKIKANAKAARVFVKQGKAWAAAHVDAEGNAAPLTFVRKGDIKGMPGRVSFRIYVPREGKSEEAAAE
jgi:hypothetical protein